MKKRQEDKLKTSKGILDIPSGEQLGFVIQRNGVIRAKKNLDKKKTKKCCIT